MRACVGGEGGAGGAKDEEKLRNFFTFLITLPQAEEKFISRRRALFFCSIFSIRILSGNAGVTHLCDWKSVF